MYMCIIYLWLLGKNILISQVHPHEYENTLFIHVPLSWKKENERLNLYASEKCPAWSLESMTFVTLKKSKVLLCYQFWTIRPMVHVSMAHVIKCMYIWKISDNLDVTTLLRNNPGIYIYYFFVFSYNSCDYGLFVPEWPFGIMWRGGRNYAELW